MENIEMYKEELKNYRNRIYIVHYACSDIYKEIIEISSICAYKFESHSPLKLFSKLNYENEKDMLIDFWEFIEEKNPIIVGWNINKPSLYGMHILRDRIYALAKSEKEIPKSYDLDFLIEQEFNPPKYDNHPKLFYYAKLNGLNLLGFQEGAYELELLRNNKFKDIDISVQRKCNIICDLLELYITGKIKIIDSRDVIKNKLYIFGIKQFLRIMWYSIKSKYSL